MKYWLIHTSAPYCGTDHYYAAYANEDPTDWLYEHWFDEECQSLWDFYSFRLEDSWEEDWDELPEEEKEEIYDGLYDNYIDAMYEEWCADCSMDVSEVNEEDFQDYVPGGDGELEVVYNERN